MLNLEQEIPLIKYANPDLKLYEKITEYLLNKINKIPIIFIDTHEEILKYINEPSVVINIDHHHDLGYNEFQINDDKIVCGNWAYKGLKNGKIQNYIWLHEYMSTPIICEEKLNIVNLNINEINLNNLQNPSKIIICSSYCWIPTQIRPLFTIWKNMIKKGDKND